MKGSPSTGWLARLGSLGGEARRWPFVANGTLAVLVLVAGLGWGFAELAGEVLEGDSHAADTRILLALRTADPADPIGPPWFEEAMRDVTALGGIAVLTFLTLAVAGLLWLQGHRSTILFLLAAVAGGLLVSTLAKWGFDRPRPDLVPHGSHVLTASFPSGHSMLSAVTYLTLAVLAARVQERRVVKVYLLALAVLVAVAVGVSRVYLGVHWPSDVVAGWCAGAVWALSCWLAARWLALWGAVEDEPEERPRSRPGVTLRS